MKKEKQSTRIYARRLAEVAASKREKILEVGFGRGISASVIEAQEVERHIVIEADKRASARLVAFAKRRPRVTAIRGFWQEVTRTLPSESFGSVLYAASALAPDEGRLFFKEAYRLLKKGGVLTYLSEGKDFSPEYLALLREAGFRDIQRSTFGVNSPDGSTIPQSDTMLVPVVFK